MAEPNGSDRRLKPHPGQARYPLPPDRGLSAYQQGAAPLEQGYEAPPVLPDPPDASSASRIMQGGVFRQPQQEQPAAPGLVEARPLHRRVAAKSKDLTSKGIAQFRRAANADGADQSGLAALTYPVILNSACDAAMAVALASTLFFAAAKAESQTRVLLYLVVNIAPFAVIAPLIGPFLDRIQQGRRAALAASFVGRALLALIIASNCVWDGPSGHLRYDPFVLYPCALGMMVLSKSFVLLKAAVTPRVLPSEIDLVRTNARLNMFALLGGSVAGGAAAVVVEFVASKLFHQPGGMLLIIVFGGFGAWLCLRIPGWVEITEGEVPATLRYHEEHSGRGRGWRDTLRGFGKAKTPFGRGVITGLWGAGTIRWMVGYLFLYVAFFSKAHHADGITSLLTLGAIGGAAGVGTFVGTAMGTRNTFGKHERVILGLLGAVVLMSVITALTHTILTAAISGFVVGFAACLSKTALDASIMDDLPEESQASGFGRSETVLQLSWVMGAATGLLAPTDLRWGFLIASAVLAVGAAQTYASHIGKSLVPNLGGKRPEHAGSGGTARHAGSGGAAPNSGRVR
ncbi:major facilitator superfamily MFS_1 [Segniliparus rotundus DSM 44985]|uniref:Major facilitator superfamily MFS_1 n=1 Tax=Segniliparus rotundus (strain ATCC BAA-972 / CDC 1076 / CIP 108378 / DSM 44985 / JCM 13578) TaxID=640132 RepID=D6ZDM7_SEGRD|nr:MFS transporter [Segniliparus rotundus]ADG99284.1 major facilitator superfamily MFS_1 [Segniliparus rotundus DSM 44985]